MLTLIFPMGNLYVYNFYLKPHVALRELKFAFSLIIMSFEMVDGKLKMNIIDGVPILCIC